MKIIFDTNIWISFLLGKRLVVLSEIFSKKDIEIYISKELIEEITLVACRSKFSNKITRASLNNLLELLNVRCNNVSTDIGGEFLIRDEKDIFVLKMAKNIPADLIVTGDKDLLILSYLDETKIITFAEFKEKYLSK